MVLQVQQNLSFMPEERIALDVFRKKFFCDGGREHVGENDEGLGLKIHPPQKSEKPL